MEDGDLAFLAFIFGAGTMIATIFVLLHFDVGGGGVVNVVIATLMGLLMGFGYFYGTKRSATGYFKLPNDLKELHEKVKSIENYTVFDEKKKRKKERDKINKLRKT